MDEGIRGNRQTSDGDNLCIPLGDIGYGAIGRIDIVGDDVWKLRHYLALRKGSPLSLSKPDHRRRGRSACTP
jgi:hypothetical protein